MELPEEIMNDIFSRLPAKSVLKFRSCSKSINRFTKDKKFIAKHTQNLTLQGGDSSFFIQGSYGYKIKICALPGNKASSSSSSSDIVPPSFLRFLNKRFGKILLSSNGLLLCQFTRKRGLLSSEEFIICNPATQTFSSITAPSSLLRYGPHAYVSMAFEPNQNRYELLLFEYDRDQQGLEHVVCRTYMPKEGVWKEREKSLHMGHSWMILCPYFQGGYRYMLSYNFVDGKTRRVLFPNEISTSLTKLHYQHVCFFKWGNTGTSRRDGIYLVIWDEERLVFNFWVLKDYQSSSWSLFLTLTFIEDMGLEEDSIVRGFTVINRDSLVFATRSDVYKYDLNGERGKDAVRISGHNFPYGVNFFPYSNTLYSCGADVKTFLV